MIRTVGARGRPLEQPARRTATNAGAEGSVILNTIKAGKGSFGFNAAIETFGDMVKDGIIDPTKVVRSALQNAASVAGLLLTAEAIITEKPANKSMAPAMPPDMDF